VDLISVAGWCSQLATAYDLAIWVRLLSARIKQVMDTSAFDGAQLATAHRSRNL
jgi:hypothetical protein